MDTSNPRASFDWCSYLFALIGGTLAAALANAVIISLMLLALSRDQMTAGFFFFVLVPSMLISFVATLVFGSATLLLVRGTSFDLTSTFSAVGFLTGYMIIAVFVYVNSGVAPLQNAFAIIGGLSGLAGGYVFGRQVGRPRSLGRGSRPK